jgi:hypothetical protein
MAASGKAREDAVRRRVLFCVVSAAASLIAISLPAAAAASRAAHGGVVAEPLYAFNTGRALTAPPGAKRGTLVRVRPYANSPGQQWTVAHGHVSPASAARLCLDVPGARYKAGTRLRLWTCGHYSSERFETSRPSVHTPVFFLAAAADRQLCVTTQSTVNLQFAQFTASTLVLAKCANLQSQAWSTTNVTSAVGQFAQFVFPSWIDDLVTTGSGTPGAYADMRPIGDSLDEEWEVNPIGGGWVFNPVDDTADCLTISGKAHLNAPLVLAACNGSAAQNFTAIYLRITASVSDYLFGADDASYCLEPGKAATLPDLPLVLGPCPNTASVQTYFWMLPDTTSLAYSNLDPATTGEFQQFLQNGNNQYAMTADGTKSGSGVSLATPPNAIGQTWTDITPGTMSAGNPDGSISIRPLNELSVCLTVPGADLTAGMALSVSTCTGASDQEFLVTMPYPTDGPDFATVSPEAAPGLCVAPQDGLTDGTPIVLVSCGSADDTWGGWNDWSAWVTPR